MNDEGIQEHFEAKRTEILKIADPRRTHGYSWISIETTQYPDGLGLTLTDLFVDPETGKAETDPPTGMCMDLPFDHVRPVAVGLLRAVYAEMPESWKWIIDSDPQEYIAHMGEMLYNASPARIKGDPMANLVALLQAYKRALIEIGKAKREKEGWKARWETAARWARLNHRRLVEQRRKLRDLQKPREAQA